MEFLKLEQNMDYLTKLNENQRIAFIKALARLANADGSLMTARKSLSVRWQRFTGFPKAELRKF